MISTTRIYKYRMRNFIDIIESIIQPNRFVHGSPNQDISIDDITTEPRDTKQGKRGRRFGGFYVSDAHDEDHAVGYAKMAGSEGALYDVVLRDDAVIETLPRGEDITRFSAERIASFTSRGIDAARGVDPRGRQEVVIFNKAAIESFSRRP
jgi:hypothetical protein